jgi:homoserine kinase
MVVMPDDPLATSKARAVLPENIRGRMRWRISRLHRCWVWHLLRGVAICFGRRCKDRIHQPYRAEICPLLPRLLASGGASRHSRGGFERSWAVGAADSLRAMRSERDAKAAVGRMRWLAK